jgi:hypothetical protein
MVAGKKTISNIGTSHVTKGAGYSSISSTFEDGRDVYREQ